MDFWASLSPEVQNFVLGAAGNAIGGLAADFAAQLLRAAGRRVAEQFRPTPRTAALQRAAGAAIVNVVADWQLAHADYADLWTKFGDWLLEPAVLSEFRILLLPSAEAALDVALLRDEFEAAGLDVARLSHDDFDALLQDLVGGFYLAAADEPELQEPLKIGLLRQMADGMGALARLAQRQNALTRQSVGQLSQLNRLVEDVRDGIRDLGDLLQAILPQLQNVQPDPLNQQAVYQLTTNALTRAGYGDLVYAEVGANGQNVAIGSHVTQHVVNDVTALQTLLQEIRDQLSRTAGSVGATELRSMEARYRQSLIDQFEKLTFRGITPSGKALSLDLAQVYVELKAVADIPEQADTYSADERRLLLEADERGEASRGETVAHLDTLRLERWRRDARREREQTSRLQRRSIGEMVSDTSQRGLVILGDPGSGKSTLLHYLALRYAQGRQVDRGTGRQGDKGKLSTDLLSTDSLLTATLPIFVPFAAYDDHLRRSGQSLPLGEFLGIYYEKWRNLPGLAPLFQEALNQGRALLLLDGLDEVLETATRQHVAEQAGALIQQWQGRGNRFVVTSRVVGYREARLPGELPHVTVLDFGRTEIEQFARQWCRTYEIWAAGRETPAALQQAAAEEKALLEDVRGNPSVEQLAANPLLLTMLALLRRQVGKLPDRRVELYERYVRTLIDNREQERSRGARQHAPARFDPHRALYHLTDLALWLQQHRPSGTARRQDLEAALMEICLRFDGHAEPSAAPDRVRHQATKEAEAFLNDMRHFAGLLGERGRDAFGFLHLTFQEYFAGRALARLSPKDRWAMIQPHLHRPRWREPILLCAGQLGVIEQRRELASELVQRILEAGSEHEEMLHRDLFLAAASMADDVGLSPALHTQLYQQLFPLRTSNIPRLQNAALTALAHLARLGEPHALPTLLAGLADATLYQPVLQNVGPLLAEPAGAPIKDAIAQRLHEDRDWQVRSAAVQALSSLVASDAQVKDAIAQRLQEDRDSSVRSAAVQALSSLVASDAQVKDAIAQRLQEDRDWPVRRAAVQALSSLVASDAQVKDAIAQRLQEDASEWVRSAAVQALSSLVASDAQVKDAIAQRLQEDASSSVRSAAVQALSSLAASDDQVKDAITQRLQEDRDWQVRSAAVQALSSLAASHAQVKDAIAQRLQDSFYDVRSAAVQALSSLVASDAQVKDAIAQRLHEDRDWQVRSAAVQALSSLVASHAQVKDAITQRLQDSFYDVRSAAVQALSSLVASDAQVKDAIAQRLQDSFYDVRSAAVQALSSLVASDAQVKDAIAQRLQEDASSSVRSAAVQALSSLVASDAQVKDAIAQRLQEDASSSVRSAAVQALSSLVASHAQVKDAIAQRLHEDTSSSVRSAAVQALSSLAASDAQVKDAIAQRLHEDRDNDVRSAAVQALSSLVASDAQVKDAIAQRLHEDRDWQVRSAAVQALSSLVASDAQVKDAITQRLHEDASSSVRSAAVQALSSLVASHAQVKDAITQRLQEDASEWVRSAAVQALSSLVASDAQVKDAIAQRLQDSFYDVRSAAVQALSSLVASDAQVKDAIAQRLQEDTSSSVRSAAVQALSSLVASDAAQAQLLWPWLGFVVEPASFGSLAVDEVERTRRQLAHSYAPLVATDPQRLAQVISMLDAVAWPLRHAALYILTALPAGPPPALLPKLRGLLDDMRGEESWPNRLAVAALFINDVDPQLNAAAIQVATAALDYATDPWYMMPRLGSEVRKEAATILGQLDPVYRDEKIFARLARVLDEDQDEEVRDAAYGALLRLAAAPERNLGS